ncbi:MAG: ABC transporter ATP-binding protein [Solirubrobacterales bacterium]|nr:ABC transporter ATP-binding protein [Solirubrobacterales bacterium]HMT04664.1 ABC transporter ATP-binding protein [Solirubrobacterales bacterium]
MSLLEVRDLKVTARGKPIVNGVDLHLDPGEALGLAGESGCGKTTTALALMKLLPDGFAQSGEITLETDGDPVRINRRTEAGMRKIRWTEISLIFQGAMNSLDPVQKVGSQIEEVILLHGGPKGQSTRSRVKELLGLVGLADGIAGRYPHQLSGGQRQRVMIALALACDPRVVIADEPTTALDVLMQAQVLQLLKKLGEELDLALILISHDLGVLAETCDRIAIMKAGLIVETGPTTEVIASPGHSYTRTLLDSLPVIGGSRGLVDPVSGESVAAEKAAEGEVRDQGTLLEARDISVTFRHRREEVRALEGIDIDWKRGEILGLVGESGCGKSTLARTMMALQQPDAGEILLEGERVTRPRQQELRRKVQMIFQDPYQTLNPRHKVAQIVREPLIVQRVEKESHEEKVRRALSDVGLEPDRFLDRYPHQLSGGQRQRVSIAAALVLEPEGLICDEPVSMLDTSVRAQVLKVLLDLKEARGLSLILITHDLSLAWSLCDRIAVMFQGQIIERGVATEVIEQPGQPYTAELVEAVPTLAHG